MTLKEMSCIPTELVADILGKSQQYVRIGLQQQRLPFGTAVKTSSSWTYHISYELLKNYVGMDRITEYEKKCADKINKYEKGTLTNNFF